ncbi:DUF7010 family protein [Brumicola pallidula]|uniref:DUF7010 family protein n=1 Tax=Brumicola pallidula TaxID=56807 RepID=UPI003F700859
MSSIYPLVGTFCIFPVAVLLSKVFGADPFSKENKLGDLIGYTHMSVIATSFPIILLLFFNYPEGLLLGMAIAYCLDFYVMSWAFGSPIFGVVAAVRVVLVSSLLYSAYLFFRHHGATSRLSIYVGYCTIWHRYRHYFWSRSFW